MPLALAWYGPPAVISPSDGSGSRGDSSSISSSGLSSSSSLPTERQGKSVDSPVDGPTSSQEGALGNGDILTTIFQSFLPPTPGPLDVATRKFFLELALQCRAFSEPALDCLWRHMSSLVPLIRLLPSATLLDESYFLVGLSHKITCSFIKYSRRVRSLHILDGVSLNPQAGVDPSVYVLLNQLLNGAPLLPGLTTLCLEVLNDTFSWYTIPILLPCSSLCTVSLGGNLVRDPASHQVALPLLVTRVPALQSLTINYVGTSAFVSFFENRILRFHQLRSLSCTIPGAWWSHEGNIPRRFLELLGSRLQQLERLTLDMELPPGNAKERKQNAMPRRTSSSTQSDATAKPPLAVDESFLDRALFPNLRTLDLFHRSDGHAMGARSVPSLLYHIGSLTFTLRPSWMSSLAEIAEILGQCPHLRDLTVMEDVTLSFSAGDAALLLARLKLESLHLRMEELSQSSATNLWPTPLRDSAEQCFGRILRAAAGLQEESHTLRRLTMPRKWEGQDASLTLLADVGRKVPQMESLVISINSSLTHRKLSILSALTLEPKPLKPNKMKYLHVRDERSGSRPFMPGECKVIAQYIDAHFPDLMSLTFEGILNPFNVGDWQFIEQLRVMHQENRRYSAYALGRWQRS